MDEADQTVEPRIGETFCQVLYPVQSPGESDLRWSSVRVGGAAGLSERVVRKLDSSEHLISAYAGTRARRDLDRRDAPLWEGDHIGFGVLATAISKGVADLNWQNDTFTYAESYDMEADRYPGLRKAEQVEVTQGLTAVLVRSDRVSVQLHAESRPAEPEAEIPAHIEEAGKLSVAVRPAGRWSTVDAPRSTRFYGRMELDMVRAMRDLGDIIKRGHQPPHGHGQ